MGKVKVVLKKDGVRSLLKSSEMMSICSGYAKNIANRAGEGYSTSEFVGANRVNVSVYASTPEATKDNMDNNTLLKAVGR